jgi:hypothetical protein
VSATGHPNYLTEDQLSLFDMIESTAAGGRADLRSLRLHYHTLCRNIASLVLPRFPQLFGVDTPERREQWFDVLLWAATVVSTRTYGPRPGLNERGQLLLPYLQLIPLLDFLNHRSTGAHSRVVLLRTPLAVVPNNSGLPVEPSPTDRVEVAGFSDIVLPPPDSEHTPAKVKPESPTQGDTSASKAGSNLSSVAFAKVSDSDAFTALAVRR